MAGADFQSLLVLEHFEFCVYFRIVGFLDCVFVCLFGWNFGFSDLWIVEFSEFGFFGIFGFSSF